MSALFAAPHGVRDELEMSLMLSDTPQAGDVIARSQLF